ncbi:MAG: hypothetical protein ACAI38_08240 [Myxococcota bacterium]|nr:hypothetical protein [Myxococcota bacterium]
MANSSDLRLIQPVSNANRGIRGDGTELNISRIEQDERAQNVRRNVDGTRGTDLATGSQNRINTGATSTSTAATSTGAAAVTPPNDAFVTASANAWTQFMADMLGALDIALSAQDAAKDGSIDSAEWNDIFSKASKDGEVTLLEISSMYAGLQDMHDKGALTDDEYQQGVGALERELSARYSGGRSDGLDQMARLYINVLEGGEGIADDATAVTNDRRTGAERLERNDPAEDVETQVMRRRLDEEDQGVEGRARLNVRRTDVNDQLATTLTDIGINRQVPDVNAPRREML